MKKDDLKEITKLTEKMSKEDYKQFLILKGYMLGALNRKKVL